MKSINLLFALLSIFFLSCKQQSNSDYGVQENQNSTDDSESNKKDEVSAAAALARKAYFELRYVPSKQSHCGEYSSYKIGKRTEYDPRMTGEQAVSEAKKAMLNAPKTAKFEKAVYGTICEDKPDSVFIYIAKNVDSNFYRFCKNNIKVDKQECEIDLVEYRQFINSYASKGHR